MKGYNMKYTTSIDDEEFNTPRAALEYIINYYGDEVLQEKFDAALESANSDKTLNVVHSPEYRETFEVHLQAVDIIKAIDIHLYTRMFKDWVDRMYDLIEDEFECNEEESVPTIFGETIMIKE